MIIAYIILILCGVFCIGFTIYEHRNIQQKNIDIEIYNQGLQLTKEYLEKELTDLQSQRAQEIESNQQILEENKHLQEKQKNLCNELNQLHERQQNYKTEIKIQEAHLESISRSVETISSNQRATVRAAFESYCDALDIEYQQKEKELNEDLANLDHVFGLQQELLLQEVRRVEETANERRAELERSLDTIKSELDKIKSSRVAAIEAQLREQEIKDQATFYTLQINEADKRDIAYLQSIEYNLREARPLRMLIWSTFYRDKLNDLATRVGANGASGIYKITHIDSGLAYVGQARDIKARWSDHIKCSLGIDTPVTSQFYAFTREKGIENFTFEILEKCSTTELNEKEKFYIDLYQTYEYGLNSNKGVNK